MNFIDDAIEEGLQALREEKYKLRMYEVEVTVDDIKLVVKEVLGVDLMVENINV